MAIAKTQIAEVYEVAEDFVGASNMERFLRALVAITAYAKNGSFRKTVDRLVAERNTRFGR